MTTETSNAAVSQDRLESLAALVVQHEAEAAKHKAEAEKAKFELRQLLDFGTHPVGNLKVTVARPNRVFDLDAFMRSYPVEINPALYKTVINNEALPPNLKNQFMVPGVGEPKVSVK